MDLQLLPCPVCGSQPLRVSWVSGRTTVSCVFHDITEEIFFVYDKDPDVAKQKWNELAQSRQPASTH